MPTSTEASSEDELEFDGFSIHRLTRQVVVAGQIASVRARAFDLLLALVERRERTVSKTELMDLVWPGLVVEENNLQVHVSALRKLLGATTITTVSGRGYQFTAPAIKRPASAASPSAVSVPPRTGVDRGTTFDAPPVLFGREVDLRALHELVPACQLVTVVGAGGMGKTALAQTFVHQIAALPIDARQAMGCDEVRCVDLAALTDAAQLLPAIVTALEIPLRTSSALEAVIGHLESRAMLMLLDNCEHLHSEIGSLVSALLEKLPRLHVLATSQQALTLRREQVYRLGSLALPAPGEGFDASRSSGAVALFEDRARARQSRFEVTSANLPVVVDICRQLDGIALAIELAAARLPLLGLEGLRSRLGERLRLLTTGPGDAASRHRTLRCAVQWSYGLLTPVQQAVFQRLGVMAGSFTPDAAQQIAADARIDAWAVLDALGQLVEKSLVAQEMHEVDEPRFHLLETMRHFALEQLLQSGEQPLLMRQHLAFFLRLAEQAQEQLTGSQQGVWLKRLHRERDNLFAAHRACDSTPDGAEHGLRLANALVRYWFNREALLQGQRVYLEATARADAPAHGVQYAVGLMNAGRLFTYRGLDADARDRYLAAIAVARAGGFLAVEVEALGRLGYAMIAMGDLAEARSILEAACRLSAGASANATAQLGRARLIAVSNLAELERSEGRHAAARPLYEECLRENRQAVDRQGTMISLNNLGMVMAITGDLAIARDLLAESLVVCDELDSRRGRLVVMEVCALIATQLTQWDQALRFDAAARLHTAQMGRRRDTADEVTLAPGLEKARMSLGPKVSRTAEQQGQAQSYEDAIADMRAWLDRLDTLQPGR